MRAFARVLNSLLFYKREMCYRHALLLFSSTTTTINPNEHDGRLSISIEEEKLAKQNLKTNFKSNGFIFKKRSL